MHGADSPEGAPGDMGLCTVDLGMVCTCVPRDLAAAEEVTRRVREVLLESGGPLVTAICGSLLMNHGIECIEIRADQWFAITATARDRTRYRVSCDEVEHGVARIWKRVHADHG
ncbi:hypothetical protein GCM10027080_24930 [Pedococcus soli]